MAAKVPTDRAMKICRGVIGPTLTLSHSSHSGYPEGVSTDSTALSLLSTFLTSVTVPGRFTLLGSLGPCSSFQCTHSTKTHPIIVTITAITTNRGKFISDCSTASPVRGVRSYMSPKTFFTIHHSRLKKNSAIDLFFENRRSRL